MKLRNPWGEVDWKGDWSPSSEKWTEEFKTRLSYDSSQTNTFWLSYDDFIDNFEIIHVCKVSSWQESRQRGKFV